MKPQVPSLSISIAGVSGRLQSWLSPVFSTGAYSYSHGLERAVELGYIHDLVSLLECLKQILGGSHEFLA
jgi:urease accessory protein UreF